MNWGTSGGRWYLWITSSPLDLYNICKEKARKIFSSPIYRLWIGKLFLKNLISRWCSAGIKLWVHRATYTIISGGWSEGGHRAEIGNVRVFPKSTHITQLFAVDLCLLLYWRVGHWSEFGLIRMLFVGVLKEDKKIFVENTYEVFFKCW